MKLMRALNIIKKILMILIEIIAIGFETAVLIYSIIEECLIIFYGLDAFKNIKAIILCLILSACIGGMIVALTWQINGMVKKIKCK